jgi:outer membrane protein assembly factor BamA
MRLVVCTLAFSFAAGAFAQGPDQPAKKREPPPGTLHSLTIKGNQMYSSADIARESGLKTGERITSAVIDQARKRLQDTELFNDVSYDYHFSAGTVPGYDVTFEIVENQQVFPMRFERIGLTPDAARACLKEHVDLYSDRIPGAEGVLKRYTSVVQDCVKAKDPNLKIHAVISNDDPQQLAVLFAPEIPAPTISQVIVSGNQAVDTGTILRAVNQIAVGVPLSDTRLKLILDGTIKPLYAAKGYAAVSFPKVETEPSKDNLGVVVKVQIADGPAFKFGTIRFRGSGMDEDVIRSTIPFKPGVPYSGDKVENFRLSILHNLKRRGMLDASVLADSQTDDSNRTVNVTYSVTPGAVYNFAKLDVQGLDITSEPAIEKLWGEKPGHPFNPDYPDFFMKRVAQEGIFDNLGDSRTDYTADASTHNVTVHLYFKGGESAANRAKRERQEKDKRTSDGSWSPW